MLRVGDEDGMVNIIHTRTYTAHVYVHVCPLPCWEVLVVMYRATLSPFSGHKWVTAGEEGHW